MEKPNVLVHFHGVERYNCAQAVLKAFAPHANVDLSCVNRFSQFGGGRAPEGECGALFAAKAILAHPEARQKTEEEFLSTIGSKSCRAIRSGKKATCAQCVQAAADAVFLRLGDGWEVQAPPTCGN